MVDWRQFAVTPKPGATALTQLVAAPARGVPCGSREAVPKGYTTAGIGH